MPAYGTQSVSIYPQSFAYLFGYPAIPGGPVALATPQYEAIANNEKSRVCSPSLSLGTHGYTERQVTWRTSYFVQPSGITIVLQGSIDDVDGDYVEIDASISTVGESRTVNSNYQFFRVVVTSLIGSATAIVKLAVM